MKGKQRLYIAYGSNLNLEQMAFRCPTAKVVGKSELKDYELLFRGGRRAAETAIKSLLPHFLSRYSSDASGFISFHHSPPHMKQALLIEVSLSFLFLYKLISMFDCVLQKLGFKPCRFVPLPDYIGIMVRGNSK